MSRVAGVILGMCPLATHLADSGKGEKYTRRGCGDQTGGDGWAFAARSPANPPMIRVYDHTDRPTIGTRG